MYTLRGGGQQRGEPEAEARKDKTEGEREKCLGLPTVAALQKGVIGGVGLSSPSLQGLFLFFSRINNLNLERTQRKRRF